MTAISLKKIMVIDHIFKTEPFHQLIKEKFEVDFFPAPLSEKEIKEKIKKYQICIIGGSTKLTKPILQNAEKLELICFAGTQYQTSIDPLLAQEFNIPILNTPGANSWGVAEHIAALALDILKKLSYQIFYAKRGIAKKESVEEMRGKEIGIIGMGKIGCALSQILVKGFSCNVSYWNRSRKTVEENILQIKYKTFNELLSNSDVIMLAIPETPETKNIIGTSEFQMMKKSSFIINAARPALVEPNALYQALTQKSIKGAAFDSYYIKPICRLEDDPYGLLSLPDDQFIITPYTASCTEATLKKMDEELWHKILNFYQYQTCLV